MREYVARVEFSVVFEALRKYGLDERHLNSITGLYVNQHAFVDGSDVLRV